MIIVGKWLLCSDGIIRPVVRVAIRGPSGSPYASDFLVDCGADRTVFAETALRRSNLPWTVSVDTNLTGVGGSTTYAVVDAALEFTCDDGRLASVRGEFAALTEAGAIDFSILGRDVHANFDLILSKRNNQVLLLAGNHRYQVVV